MADTFRTTLADADNSIFDALGETATVTSKGSLVGVFEDESDYDLEVQGTRPVFNYQESDMTIVVGDVITYASISYTVQKIESDGMGMGKLVLSLN